MKKETEIINDKNLIRKELKRTLSKKRYIHTMGVTNIAIALAMRYEEDFVRAELAGMLHDCAKCEKATDWFHVCKEYQIPITDVEKRNPYLLHAKLGAYMAEHTFGISDKQVLNAIQYHTTGHPNMTMLEKIIFVADYIEPNRESAPNLKEKRKMAFVDIDCTLIMILKDTLDYLKSTQMEIDETTIKTYEYYKKEFEQTHI